MRLRLFTRFGLSRGGAEPPPEPVPFMSTNPAPSSTSSNRQVGWEFTTNQAITVTKLRCYVGANGSEIIRLWRVSDGALLGSVTVSAVTNTWVEGTLGTPISLASGTAYAVTTQRADASSRAWKYSGSLAGYTFSPMVNYVRVRWTTAQTFPSVTEAPGTMWGLADCVGS